MANKILAELKPIPAKDIALDGEKTAAAIVSARHALNIEQKILAMQMGITQSYLCDLEKNRRVWTISLFNRAKVAMEELL